MKETETLALCGLFLFCSSSVIQGEHESNSSTRLQNLPVETISSPPQGSSTARPESFSRTTLLTASSGGDSRAAAEIYANGTFSPSYNDTTNSTVAPGFPTGAAGTTVNTPAPTNLTSVAGNLTDSQDGSDHEAGDNQTSTASNTTLSNTTTPTTPLPKAEPEMNTSANFTSSTTPQASASTLPQITTRALAASTQSRFKSSTVTTKGTSAPTTTTTPTTTSTTTKTTPTTEFSSTPVLAKARVDNPSELNVGDDTEYSGISMDPLLAGLVSVFVVTAAIVALLIFLKFRHRNEHPEFRRLQDLPMDDMMEDTPLSMYSY